MPGDHLEECGEELVAGPCVLAVDAAGVLVPQAGDLPDRQALLEAEVQELDPLESVFAVFPRPLRLQRPGLAEERPASA